MSESKKLGKKGEELAVAFLEEKGYRIVARNWKHHKAEVDIIAEVDDLLVFAEVKTRSSTDFGLPHEFLKPPQIKRLVTAANAFCVQFKRSEEVRFDIVAISIKKTLPEIEHIERAFYWF
ncbi:MULTISPECIES: YraN family protein [unclassified Myroides]|uniref:YraN family protein n=1 Tax=unclassified Myroides TaxID=2642485 RepID=UPI0015F8DB64|nr:MULTISPECIES: YraN family protein [unclassified Myroides]MBB1151284.1 YraN family protein [Myroides sp. NP-2]MDM1407939.1 YraN family protein [Myroides sp. DF42-4-2]